MRGLLWLLPVLLLAALVAGPAYARTPSQGAATHSAVTSTAQQQPAQGVKSAVLSAGNRTRHAVARVARHQRARATSRKARTMTSNGRARQYHARLAKYYGRLAKHYQSLAARYARLAQHQARLARQGVTHVAKSTRQRHVAPRTGTHPRKG